MLEWKSDYETGVPTIDSQHKLLFDLINHFEKLGEKAQIERSEADQSLKSLEDYFNLHFNHEEDCMARFHCPAYAKNKKDHELFFNILKFYKGQCETAPNLKAMMERLHTNMVWWINQHILKVDIQLKDSAAAKIT